MIFNLNPTKDKYYRQLNNLIKPTIRCKPTGTVEGLDLAGWELPTGKYKQPEDNLTYYCDTNFGEDASEDWRIIADAINNHFLPNDKPVIGPRWDWNLQKILFDITKGIPFVASTYLTKTGHVVVLVGFETEQTNPILVEEDVDISKITNFIIDDPYGDRTTGKYDTSKTGHNNKYKPVDFLGFWRNTGIQIKLKK